MGIIDGILDGWSRRHNLLSDIRNSLFGCPSDCTPHWSREEKKRKKKIRQRCRRFRMHCEDPTYEKQIIFDKELWCKKKCFDKQRKCFKERPCVISPCEGVGRKLIKFETKRCCLPPINPTCCRGSMSPFISMPPNSRVETVEPLLNKCGPIFYRYKQIIDLNDRCPDEECGTVACDEADSMCKEVCQPECEESECEVCDGDDLELQRGGEDKFNPCNSVCAPPCPPACYADDEWSCVQWCEYALFVACSVMLLVSAPVIAAYWMLQYKGTLTLDWNDSTVGKQIFNAHPVLMMAGFITFLGLGVLSFRIFCCFPRMWMKIFHMLLHLLAMVFISLGFICAFQYNKVSGFKHFYTMHSWLGLLTMLLLVMQFFSGFFTFLIGMCCCEATVCFRERMIPIHGSIGLAIFLLSIATAIAALGSMFASNKHGVHGPFGLRNINRESERIFGNNTEALRKWIDRINSTESIESNVSNYLTTYTGIVNQILNESWSDRDIPGLSEYAGSVQPMVNKSIVFKANRPNEKYDEYHIIINVLAVVLAITALIIMYFLHGPAKPDTDCIPCQWRTKDLRCISSKMTVATY